MTQTVLDHLRCSTGEWLTPDELMSRMSLTEPRLREEIRRIRQAGYTVKHHSLHGYRLTAVPDRLVPDEIQRGLGTRIIGRDILTYDAADSTMDMAEGLAEKGARDGTTIFAEEQRMGRGRVGRRWYCPRHRGILMTTILRPRLEMDRICLLAGMVTVAAAEAVRSFLNLPALIKWPNDIVINDRKVCGILVEAVTHRGKEPYFLAGIGLNVNLTRRELPRDVVYPATSLLIEKGSHVERIGLSRELLHHLDKWYIPLRGGRYKRLRSKWMELFSLAGRSVRLRERNREHTGKIVDLSDRGGLIVELDGRRRRTFRGEYLTIKEIIR